MNSIGSSFTEWESVLNRFSVPGYPAIYVLGCSAGHQATGLIDPLVLPSVTRHALLVEREWLTGALARAIQCLHQRHGLKCIFEVRRQG